MSEGDKSTIALCFFLARLEIKGVSDKIVIFDDPLSSFDYSRRNATISHLAKIANNAAQFILLTHDLAFASDFTEKCSFIDWTGLSYKNGKEQLGIPLWFSTLQNHDYHSLPGLSYKK